MEGFIGMKKLFLGMMLSVFAASVLGTAVAFPGDAADEACAALIEQAAAQGLAAPDCVPDTGLSALEERVANIESVMEPVPNVVQVAPIDEIVNVRKFRKLNAGANIYDAPNGNVIRTVGGGLTISSYIGLIEGWVQLRQNEWAAIDDTLPYENSAFAGVEISGPLERPFAWILVPAHPSRYPGGPEDETLPELVRYQKVNIFGIEVVDGWEWYMVAKDQWVTQIRVAKVKPVARPADIAPDEKWVAVDLFEQTLVAYQGDEMKFATLISSGLPQWSTEEGLFKIYQRWVRGPMSAGAGVLGDAYYIENIANIMYFNVDMALHAAYWHDKFGYRQSRGCVNMSLMDANWVYEWSRDDEDAWVYVYSSGEYRNDLPDWAIRASR
jgi:lipoprotein-anchoring transpeptidase ErfK/SrfK